jgi:acetyl/propionyl-CoA carboxylase alpha subunit
LREFKRVLVANRGEIALRVIRALKSLEIESVAIYSDADTSALHALQADRAFNLPGVYARDTYLNAQEIVEIARKADCDAIHPGYGFLSENSEFAKLSRKASIRFIGPSPETLEISGNKFATKKLVESKGIPVVPYSKKTFDDVEEAIKVSQELGFPVLLKSAFGGGGRGIKEAKSKEEIRDAFESSRREAKASFGRFAVYVEKKLLKPRHIEIQILAGKRENEVIHLGERECSIQRRYQKLVELSPSPVVDEKARDIVSSYALGVAKAVKYTNAGTIEFLRDSETGRFYFLEINSRLQVEHPITELVTGIDLVQSQIEIESRGKLPFSQKDVRFNGCAVECRINAEDPLSDFLPDSGRIEFLRIPSGPGIRVDTALYEGLEVPPYYDSLLAKLVSWGRSFDEARRKALVALSEFKIVGVRTTISFHRQLLTEQAFASGMLNTSFVEDSGVILKLRMGGSSSIDKFMIAAFLLSKNQFESTRSVGGQVVRRLSREQRGGRFVDGV